MHKYFLTLVQSEEKNPASDVMNYQISPATYVTQNCSKSNDKAVTSQII